MEIESLKSVNNPDETQFGWALSKVLSPSRPLQSQEYLKGRDEQLRGIKQALYSGGRHVFIHGFRGVGKTSLARTAALQLQHSSANPIFLACSHDTTFSDIVRDMLDKALANNPSLIEKDESLKVEMTSLGLKAEAGQSQKIGKLGNPLSINDAINYANFLVKIHSPEPVVVIDEFDLLSDTRQQELFADYIKQISDLHVPVKFIFCGIGESIDQLMKAHRSSHRYFHTVKLDRLPWEARQEIVEMAASQLGITIDKATTLRICKISDGFPHYIHLVAEKLFWAVYEANNGGKVTPNLFEVAMQNASDSMEAELKIPYEKATRKYSNDMEEILFAVADGYELQRPSREIRASYIRIMTQLDKEPVSSSQFNAKMNQLKRPECSEILLGSRQGWYEYREKVIRGYARLRAEQKGVDLEVDHPLSATKYKPKYSGFSN